MDIVFPEGTFATINKIRNIVGRGVTFTTIAGQITCPSGCTLDPVTNTSVDSFCSGCDGKYWVTTYSGYLVSGHVRWTDADRDVYSEGGKVPEGDCRVTIAYSSTNLGYVEDAYTVTVDDKVMYVDKFRLKGIRGPNEEHEPSRIMVQLLEEER